MKKLTVIIPTYNTEKYIEKCINSIINQTYKNLEIIIIDDGSTDNSGKICDEYAKKDNRIKIIHKKNEGVSKARNLGIQNSTGYYITFVDADDYIDEDMYRTLIKEFNQNNKIEISMCNFFMEYNDKDIRKQINSKKNLNKNEMLENIFLSDYFCGFSPNKIYKKDIIQRNNLKFDENIHICEDLLFNCEYINLIEQGCYIDKKMYHYVQHNDSAYNKKYNDRWNTVIDAYEKIKLIIKEDNKENFSYSYIYALLNLKEKILQSSINNEYIKDMIERKINENKKGIYRNRNINIKAKIKIFVKMYMIKFFVFTKNIKAKYK